MPKDLFAQTSAIIDEIDLLYSLASSKAGLSQSAFAILYTLAYGGDGISQKELCERCWMGKQTVNSSVKRLVSQGRLVLVPGHGRETLVTLTDAGRQLVEERIAPVIDAERAAFEVLGEDEQRTLMHLLGRMRDGMRELLASAEVL